MTTLSNETLSTPQRSIDAALLRQLHTEKGLGLDDLRDLTHIVDRNGAAFPEMAKAACSADADAADDDATPETGIPDIDVDDLFGGAPVVARMMRHVHSSVVCSRDLPVLTALALLSTAVACKAEGRAKNARDGYVWSSPPCLYIIASVGSGEKKTLVRARCGGGLIEQHDSTGGAVRAWHATLEAHMNSRHNKFTSRRRTKERELAAAQAAGDTGKEDTVSDELTEIKAELAKRVPTAASVNWYQLKPSPARFVQQAQAAGFVACLPDEGKATLAEFTADRKRDYLEPLLSGFSGAAFGNDTISGEVRGDLKRFRKPRLVMFLPIQPVVLAPQSKEDTQNLRYLAERGFLARFLIARPRRLRFEEAPLVRQQFAAAMDVPGARAEAEATVSAYHALFRTILHADGDKLRASASDIDPDSAERRNEESIVGKPHPLVPARPWVFDFTPDAAAALYAYQDRTQDSAWEGGPEDQDMIREFVTRIAEHVHRLATLLAIVRKGDIRGGGEVTLDDVERAIRFIERYMVPHARQVYKAALATPILTAAQQVLAVLVKHGGKMRERELMSRMPNNGAAWKFEHGIHGKTLLRNCLDDLAEQGLVILERLTTTSTLITRTAKAAP